MKTKTPIFDFLIRHAEQGPVSFHMPGHKGSAIYRRFGYEEFLAGFMDCDITEIPGADNLFQAEGILKQAQDAYRNLYDTKQTYLLINGTSCGIIAAILAAVPKGKKLIMARNCHKSVFNALTLADVQPLYAYPEFLPAFGISGAIMPEEIEGLLKSNPDAEAVILPSPNYYGICSDIKAISKIAHHYGKILIVDQAHGAHLKLFSKFGIPGLPKSAEESGADIIINSTHKTLASFTQSAILNINSDRISPYTIEDKLQCMESTSPSYLLMASLDINAAILAAHGPELMEEWTDNLNCFYEEAAQIHGLEVMERLPGMDWTKINLSFRKLGISGSDLEKRLIQHNIFIELYTGDLVMCMTGIGNSRSHMEQLLAALQDISKDIHKGVGKGVSKDGLKAINKWTNKDTDKSVSKDEAVSGETEMDDNDVMAFQRAPIYEIPRQIMRVPLLSAEGLICASSVIPYPPGIPLVCPGEKFERETLLYIKALREKGEKVIGVNDLGQVVVGAPL